MNACTCGHSPGWHIRGGCIGYLPDSNIPCACPVFMPKEPESGSPKCKRCGFVMCEQFDYKSTSRFATLATPNGTFRCYHCTPMTAQEARELE